MPCYRHRAPVALIVALVGFAAPALAQDAESVLQLSVGYRTQKNSATLTDAARAEVERLEAQAQAAAQRGAYDEATKHFAHARAVVRGERWTFTRALGDALTATMAQTVLEPGQRVTLRLGELFVPDEAPPGTLAGTVTLLKMTGDDPIAVVKPLEGVPLDLRATPFAMDVTVPDVPAGAYRLGVALKTDAGIASRLVTVRVDPGLGAAVASARDRAAKARAALDAKTSAAALAALPSIEYRLGLVDLANAGEIDARTDFRQALVEGSEWLDALEAGRDPFAATRGDFKKAYRSKVDGTLQPYRVFVPSAYDGGRAFPLVVALHGMGGDENSYFSDFYGQGAFKREAEKHGYIVVCPKGRGRASMYRGPAEQDVMDVLAEAKRAYKIDPDRIYLTGHSMGGYGTWSVAMSYPDLFAALAPISGGGDTQGMKKIAHIPQLVVHGDNDKTVPVARSREMVAAAKALGAEVKYLEIPGGSHVDVAVPAFDDIFDWFDAHKKNGARTTQPQQKP